MISSSSQPDGASSNNDLTLNFSQTNLFRTLKTKSLKTALAATPTGGESGDQRTMDAADTLVSLAHSASSTPTVESKPFRPADDVIEKTIKLDQVSTEHNTSLVESACKLLIEQVLKSCPTVNLSSITIKASTKQSSKESDEPAAKKSRAAASDSESDNDSLRSRPAPTLATGRRPRNLELPPDEARKREDRRERNKQAAARCRRRREELAETLSLKTSQLNKEQDNLKRNYDELLKEKSRWQKMLNDHLKECKRQECDSVALTPTSAGLSQKENILNLLETKSGNGLTRPSNLNLKSTTSATLNSMVTPSSATLSSVLQGIALAFGQSTTPAQFSLGSNNNISFVMTPTFNMNTPTAFLSLTPIESQLGTLNTPMLIQSNPLLGPRDSESKNNAANNASKT